METWINFLYTTDKLCLSIPGVYTVLEEAGLSDYTCLCHAVHTIYMKLSRYHSFLFQSGKPNILVTVKC